MDSAASPAPSHAQPSSDNIPEQPNESSLSNTTPATPEAALKRSYLDLLQPSQVVDLCLALDALVPPAAKESIWPADFSKAIAQLVAASLLNVASPPPPQVGPPAVNGAAGPPGPTAIKSPTPGVAPTPNAVAGPSTTATAVVSAAAPPPLAVHPAAYPSPLARPPSFPHTTSYYGGQAPAFTNPYTMPYGYAPPPVADRPPTKRLDPSHPNAHLGPDDLPSYEEMIVEALEACGDPEGAPPKTLFQWMENQYPLHSNFRPSASQALQKAFKRGRLTKNDGGKYAISQTWEGGSSGKRMRRPHIQQPSPYARPSDRPGTAAPTNPQQQPYGAAVPASGTFAYGSSGWTTSGTPIPSLAGPSTLPHGHASSQPPAEGENGITPETWRVLQSIIAEAQKAQNGTLPDGVTVPKTEPQDISLANAALAFVQPQVLQQAVELMPNGAPGANTQLSDRDREALQAQLNLFNEQLQMEDMSDDDDDDDGEEEEEEEAEEGEEEGSAEATRSNQSSAAGMATTLPPWSKEARAQGALRKEEEEEEEEDEDDEDMEMVDVGTAVAV